MPMPTNPSLSPAETALSLLFKKLHPHLEDAAHALAVGSPTPELEKLHARLIRARHQVAESLENLAQVEADASLSEVLETLSANLTPVGEAYQQSLILTQLCLEEAPADLLPFAPEGCVAGSPWGPRMTAFLKRLNDPSFQARERWAWVDPDLGDEGLGAEG
jgi:hypothetical protein